MSEEEAYLEIAKKLIRLGDSLDELKNCTEELWMKKYGINNNTDDNSEEKTEEENDDST
jgi:hypothetical protein